CNILTAEELKGAKSVLSAAALTYVVATLTAIVQLLRFISIFTNRR
ncbi:MAG: zinc metallopeptidase, partial [Lachnospiraceae bacterium]|nr:zinc metallopeptidase [Lachnospiraceae bacterium]